MNDLSRITERYNLDKLIHAGDAASVFRATDLRSGEPVALKLLRGSARFSEPQRRERFERAARALAECRHRCLPSLLDFGVTAGGSAFLVTEYLPGATLDLLTGSPAERVLPLLIPVLGALEELDRHQLAHRGLRADNLLVVPRGKPRGDELPADGANGAEDPDGANDVNDAASEQVKILGWGSATWGAGEEGRRADLGAFAELTCAVLGARVERTPAAVVTLPAAAGTRIADAAELAILLSLLLQPGGPLPASLYAELRRAFRQALHGGADPEATQPRLPADAVTAPSGAAASRRRPAGPRPATRQLADLDDLDDLEQETRALRGDITMAVPRERLPRTPQARPPAAAGAAQSSAAEPAAAQARSPLTAAGIRMETMPSFLASDLAGSPTGTLPPTAANAANAAEVDAEPAAGTAQEAAPGATAPEWTATRSIAPPAPLAAVDRNAPARATSGAILPFPSVQAAAGPAPAATTDAAAVPAEASLPWAAPAPTAPIMPATPALPAATAATADGVPRAPAPAPSTAAPGAGAALNLPDAPAIADRPAGMGGSWRAARRTRLALYGAAAALLVLAAVAGPPLVRRMVAGYPGSRRAPSAPVHAGAAAGRPSGGVRVPPAAELPAAAAAQPLDPRLAAAQALLAGGDPGGARRVLAEIPAGEAAALAPADRADFERLTAALAADRRARRTQIAADLAAGFRRSDVRRLGAALSGARREPDLPPAIRQDLDRARQAVELDARLSQGGQGGQSGPMDRAAQQSPGDVLHTATLLLAILPRHARALDLRDQAARAVEAQADEALAAGDAGRAAALASSLRQDWPDRPGLQERATRIESQRRGDEHLEEVLAAAARAEAAGQPLQGLDALAAATPSARYRERFGQQRAKLDQLLARLDAAPPSITLRPGWKAEYDKGETVVVPLRITDDLAVKSAEGWVRPEGAAAFQPVAVRHLDGASYEVDLPPSLHQNQPLDLYVTATDNSGHQAFLGSRDKPLKIKRRNWIEKIFTGKEKPATGRDGRDTGG